ncbi:MAG: terpene cyclase/mutase family protein [Planctomycetales bacterium]|nr:terpene cyclase/mutase family protein [Planctomycetales bacterium]
MNSPRQTPEPPGTPPRPPAVSRATPPGPARRSLPPQPPRVNPWSSARVSETEAPEHPWWQIWRRREGRRRAGAFVTSMVVHAVLLIALALIVVRGMGGGRSLSIDAGMTDQVALRDFDQNTLETNPSEANTEASETEVVEIKIPFPESPTLGAPSESTPQFESTVRAASSSDLRSMTNLPAGGGMEGRSSGRRQELLEREGGTAGSEEAVKRGLEWLAAHQHEDGSWWFDLRRGPCRGRCRHSGTVGSSTAATGLALLCFLGHGETPEEGEYSEVVRKGLYYLQSRIRFTAKGADLQEGTMYGHAIATLAFTEAYGMTQDPTFRDLAQSAIDFICAAQGPNGGWRYSPGQPGDMTVSGWQMMALHSAHLSRLNVPHETTTAFSEFLDNTQLRYGALYRYLPEEEEEKPSPTAIGLLCRMYMGWPRTVTPIREGAAYLADLGPSRTDLYFDYYATQMLHHFGDPHWESWNEKMREHLIRTQERSGHEAGSWHFGDPHGDQGGRLYSTAMAIMTLEVYYRYLPLYDTRAVEFPY